MQTQEVGIQPNVEVSLKTDMEMLDEVVVVGYGSAKKLGSVVGSIGKVDSEALEKTPTVNFTDALSGQVSGLSVLSNSGDPTQTASIRLRGVSSINAGTTPLFILDGAPVESSVFNTLNPNDIENITVLKDASSTAIYGSRAANGVIVITSKRGKLNEKATVTLRGQYGFSSLVKDRLEMMNASEYLKFRELIGQPASAEAYNAVNLYGIDTDWRKEMFSSSAPTYSVDATIRGGSGNSTYYLSLNHMNQEGIIEQSGIRRETLRFNLDSRVKDWLKVGLNANLGVNNYETNTEISDDTGIYLGNPALYSRILVPYDSPYYYTIDENGDIQWGEKADYYHFSRQESIDHINDTRKQVRRQITANVMLFQELTPIKGLTLRAQQAVNAFDYDLNSQYYPYETITTPMGDAIQAQSGSAQKAFQRYYSFTYTNTAEYKFNIKDDHHLTVLAGQESIMYSTDNFNVSGEGITDVRLNQIGHLDKSTLSASGGKQEYVFNSYFLRGEYNFDEKYYVEASFRRDGSSRFSKDNRWASFYAVGLMWNLKKEQFLNDVEWINDLRLKGSYGTTGNSEIGNYASLGLIASSNKYNYNGNSGWIVGTVGNNSLTWETQKNLTIGVATRLFDRVDLNVDYYHKLTVDMLMDIPLSYTTGHGSGMGNVGSLLNTGVEITAGVDIFNTNDFAWRVQGTFAYNKTEIRKLYNGLDELAMPDYGMKWEIGHDPYEYYLVKYVGVDPRDGEAMFYDLDGNITKNLSTDYMQLSGLNMISPWTGGFGTTVSWKGLTLNADFSWIGERYLFNKERLFTENPANLSAINQTTTMLDMWMEPGQITNVPKASVSRNYFGVTTYFYENAAFVRLKNLTLSYDLPSQLLKKTKVVKGVKVFFTGRNLLTFTGFSGLDPEVDSNGYLAQYPNPKQYSIGLEVKF